MKASKVIFGGITILMVLLIQYSLQIPLVGFDFGRNFEERRIFFDYDDSPLIFDDFASFENTFNRRRNIEAIQERQLDLYRPPYGLKEEALLRRLSQVKDVVGYDPLAKVDENEKKRKEPDEKENLVEIIGTFVSEEDTKGRKKRDAEEHEYNEDDEKSKRYHHRRTFPLMVFK